MTDIKSYIIALLAIAIIRWLIPKFGKAVNWLIVKLVVLMEKLIKGTKMGKIRKKWCLRILRLFGVKATKTIDELIECVVDIMNSKQDDIKSDITEDISNKVDDGINKLNNK
jgi:hypothetical protein